nr:PREDICTED: sterol regulatory element-binding protein 2 [Latimeria chalumnae]|eukprot:XP_014353985.1 PREDICTED: sterol regulatory element-binding protein 2 [Latimeria chalumnae]
MEGETGSGVENLEPLTELGDELTLGDIDEMLQFVSNQAGEFPDLFEDQFISGFPGPETTDQSHQRTSYAQQFQPAAPQPPAPQTPAVATPQRLAPLPLQPRLPAQVQPQQQTVVIAPTFTSTQTRIIQQPLIYQTPTTSFQVFQPQVQSLMTSPQVHPVAVQTLQTQRLLTQSGAGTIQTLAPATATVQTVSPQVQQVPVLVQPQIIKTDSLVLTTLKTDGSPVVAAVQNPALTTLTAPIQTAALQMPVCFFLFCLRERDGLYRTGMWETFHCNRRHYIGPGCERCFVVMGGSVRDYIGPGRRKHFTVTGGSVRDYIGPGCGTCFTVMEGSMRDYIGLQRGKLHCNGWEREGLYWIGTWETFHYQQFFTVLELILRGDSMHKSGVLKKAIDYIKYLQQTNHRLRQENMALKLANQKNIPLFQVKEDPDSPATLGMLDRSRVLLCTLTFLCLSFNPLTSLLEGGAPQGQEALHHRSGRSMLGFNTTEGPSSWLDWMFPTLILWLLNSVVVLGVFVKLLVHGEPVMRLHSRSSIVFWRRRKQAELDLVQGDFAAAAVKLQACLSMLGRALPTSRLDLACSLFWNLIRYGLQRLGLVRWMLRRTGGYQEEARTSAREAALVYHKLHQLHVTGKAQSSFDAFDLNLALSAVNLAECAEAKVIPRVLAEIYVTAAITLKTRFRGSLRFLVCYFLRQAQQLCQSERTSVPDSLPWLLHPLGHRFFMECDWSLCSTARDGLYSVSGNPADPLVQVQRAFCENLLERAVHSLLNPEDGATVATDNSCEFSGTLQYLQLMKSYADSGGTVAPGCGGACTGSDPVCRWWCSVVMMAVCWLQGDDSALRSLSPEVERIPKSLETVKSPLWKATFHVCKAMQASLLAKADGHQSALYQCKRASIFLWSSLSVSSGASSSSPLSKAVQLLTCDLLLSVRTSLWQKQATCSGQASAAELAGFQRDLSSLRKLRQSFRPAHCKLFLHEATVRLMAGASPTRTHQLLEHSLRRRAVQSNKHGVYWSPAGQRERAAAILLACRHLPLSFLSSPGQRVVLLAEAARTLEKVGDRRSFKDCQQMLVKLGGGTTIAAS